ncbi:hypothetical protein Sjap_007968 [Stephania japonica]|uniref:Uncharacterized protein n=1 Tax=Stephania japonica TaxID=461633 RepID=A0AAP0JP79_9MAGN
MADALFELEQILRSSKYKINREEEAILGNCKAAAIRVFGIGASVGAGLVWAGIAFDYCEAEVELENSVRGGEFYLDIYSLARSTEYRSSLISCKANVYLNLFKSVKLDN